LTDKLISQADGTDTPPLRSSPVSTLYQERPAGDDATVGKVVYDAAMSGTAAEIIANGRRVKYFEVRIPVLQSSKKCVFKEAVSGIIYRCFNILRTSSNKIN
jgi:hypothetical protein